MFFFSNSFPAPATASAKEQIRYPLTFGCRFPRACFIWMDFLVAFSNSSTMFPAAKSEWHFCTFIVLVSVGRSPFLCGNYMVAIFFGEYKEIIYVFITQD